jgi:hypothetical protein
MWIYLLHTIKEVLYSNLYVQNILQTDESTITCMIFGLNKNTIQYMNCYTDISPVHLICRYFKGKYILK